MTADVIDFIEARRTRRDQSRLLDFVRRPPEIDDEVISEGERFIAQCGSSEQLAEILRQSIPSQEEWPV